MARLWDTALNPEIAKFKWTAVQTGKGNPYQGDPAVQLIA